MSARYKYSVIIPHRNRMKLLRKLIQSIPQTEQIEVIIVDDCSEKAVINELNSAFEDRTNTKVLFNDSDNSKGAGWARNIGIDHALGEYILFADSDDSFTKGAFKYFENETTDNAPELVLFKTNSINKEGNWSNRTEFRNYLLDKTRQLENLDEIKQILTRIDPPWAKLYKTELIKKNDIKFDEIHYSNDVMFNLLVIIYSKHIKVSPKTVYNVLDHPGSLIKVKTEDMLDQRFDACIRCNNKLATQSFSGNSFSITGGFIWNSKQFGLSKLIEFLRKSFNSNARIIYPIHRYLIAFFMKIIGLNQMKVRFYIVFGK